MKVKCSLCGKPMKDKLPYSDPTEVLDMCKGCENIQDVFLERRLKEIKDTKERRRKDDKK